MIRRSRTTLLCAGYALSASAAAAQTPTVHYELSWRALPSNGSILMFGDHAQVTLTARLSPPIGTQVTLQNNTTGTIAGLSSIWCDLRACDATTQNPQWTLSGTGFQGTTGNTWGLRSGWSLGGSAGTVDQSLSINHIQAGQFILPGQTASAANPVIEIWRGKWAPQIISPGLTTRFTIAPHESRVLVRTGTTAQGNPIYTSIVANSEVSTIQILHDTGAPPPCFPGFWAAPPDQLVLPGEAVVFSREIGAPPAGCPPWNYRWRRGCTWLEDGGNISGSRTPTLRIDPVTAADADFYYLSIGNWQGGSAARLTIGCYANCDHSTGAPALTANDFQCFLNRFAASDSYANCDHSTGFPALTANDFLCFLNKYATGCS